MSLSLGFWAPISTGGWKERHGGDDPVDPTWEQLKQVTLTAEQLGFEYTLIAVRWFGPVLEALTTTAALAAVTERIHMITAVHTDLIQPQVIAKMGANIDQISRGRFHINLVSGNDMPTHVRQHTMYGGTWHEHDDRYARSAEYIRAIKQMWSQQPATMRGEYYELDAVDLQPKPVQQPFPPTFVGGSSEAGRELTAVECDWFFLHGKDVESAAELIADVRRRAEAHGRTVRFALSTFVMWGDRRADIERRVEELAELGKTDRLAAIHTEGLKSGTWGTPQDVADQIARYQELGVEMALLQFDPIEQELPRFGAEVMPLLDVAPATTTA
ncbi:LLM class flavin-dependent oxidoreductase [Conexibacter stalactiti]|uniref:LLM class flavin-dependent oxidoreductase n=1 Tax=Conexibacter stalactiti TaxID=1940611 RepID=A0ABU4HJL6_9ACTN|nr:LLM class flavin-dependent oxidoreductase [Conexibacter stalactiti]MDW5593445.1 LLM class flavin-dependent oxidoreductase [Conexibacter stalactiti]MEC5034086.1 LLM class flavin-dependent oxidoreductase [Conexibacter stalactiti]